MADNATDTTPGTHPDAVVINSNGSVTTRGGKGWVWVTDEATGARVDVPASMLPRAGVAPVPGYPVHYGPVGRAPKTRLQLGDKPPTAGRAAGPAEDLSPELAAARAASGSLIQTPRDATAEALDAAAGVGEDQADAAGAGDTEATTTAKRNRRAGA